MSINYSKGFINLAIRRGVIRHVLNLKKAKIVTWRINGSWWEDVRKVFKQTESEDAELIQEYSKYTSEGANLMRKAKDIAQAVNNKIEYANDHPNWGKAEYWAKPIETHRKGKDDCDGYSNLIVKVLRLLGAKEWQVFTRVGMVVNPRTGNHELHANPIILNERDMRFYPIEGSYLASQTIREFGRRPMNDHPRYRENKFICNDKESYSDMPWLRFV